jgi:hypothetical protein
MRIERRTARLVGEEKRLRGRLDDMWPDVLAQYRRGAPK